MKTALTTTLLMAACFFAFQFFGDKDWQLAIERSWFAFVGCMSLLFAQHIDKS